jgi:hypothetical protein
MGGAQSSIKKHTTKKTNTATQTPSLSDTKPASPGVLDPTSTPHTQTSQTQPIGIQQPPAPLNDPIAEASSPPTSSAIMNPTEHKVIGDAPSTDDNTPF